VAGGVGERRRRSDRKRRESHSVDLQRVHDRLDVAHERVDREVRDLALG